MENSTNIRVLNDFRSFFLRLLTAYNAEHFQNNRDWRRTLHSAKYAFYTAAIFILPAFGVWFCFWYLIGIYTDLEKTIESLPTTLGAIHMELTLITMIRKNRMVVETINQVQKIVNQRKLNT